MKYSKPKYLRNYLQIFYPETNVMVRHANHPYRLSVPRTNSKLDERAFAYIAPRLFNGLLPIIKEMHGDKKFEK